MSESKHICGIGHGVACNACAEEENERLRVERWHATRDAALTGLCANQRLTVELTWELLAELAQGLANWQHGPLVKP
jgi:hypothetical protein